MNLNKYAAYTLEDYLEDPMFRAWVFRQESQQAPYWATVFSRYPEQEPIARQARVVLLEMEAFYRPAALREQPVDEAFVERLKERVKDSRQGQSAVVHRSVKIKRLAIAATIVLLLGMFSWLWFQDANQGMEVVRTDYADWKTLVLPDGSVVRLNANSEMRYHPNWEAGKNREVWLRGEAFFEVTKDSLGAKFTVFTEDLAVEVLGTAFNVHSRGEATEVFLEEGSVRLDLGDDEKLLEPGDFISYSAKSKAVKTLKKASEEAHSSWKDGSLIIRDKPVAEIVQKIEEIFGYEVTVKNKALLQEHKTVGIPMDRIEEAIPILESIFGTEISLEDQQLIVH